MEREKLENIKSLEQIRTHNGNMACISHFEKMRAENHQSARMALGAEKLTFPTLYILLPSIGGDFGRIDRRSALATKIVSEILAADSKKQLDLSMKNSEMKSVLLWMLQTGTAEHELDDGYRKVIDITCAVLIDTYGSKSILPKVCDLIFERKKRGQYTHDLVWAYFRSKDAEAIRLLAERLDAEDEKEKAFVHHLLNIKEGAANAQADSEGYKNWLTKYAPHLYFTGMGHQFATEPEVWGIKMKNQEGSNLSEMEAWQ